MVITSKSAFINPKRLYGSDINILKNVSSGSGSFKPSRQFGNNQLDFSAEALWRVAKAIWSDRALLGGRYWYYLSRNREYLLLFLAFGLPLTFIGISPLLVWAIAFFVASLARYGAYFLGRDTVPGKFDWVVFAPWVALILFLLYLCV